MPTYAAGVVPGAYSPALPLLCHGRLSPPAPAPLPHRGGGRVFLYYSQIRLSESMYCDYCSRILHKIGIDFHESVPCKTLQTV